MVILTLCPLLGKKSHSVIVTGVWWCHTINLCDIGMVILTLCPLLGKKSHSVIVTGVLELVDESQKYVLIGSD